MAEVVVEILNDVFCWVDGQVLRGKITVNQLREQGLKPDDQLTSMQGWHGHHVSVDEKARKVRIFNPLRPDTREYEDFKARCERAGAKGFANMYEVTHANLSDEEVKEYVFWLRRTVEDGHARVLGGGELSDVVPQRIVEMRRVDELRRHPMYDGGFVDISNMKKEPAGAKS